MSTLEERTRFEPAEVEPRIVERWIASGLHHPEPGGTPEENYSIAVPPPNVTGALHMGHALNGSVQDTLIRYHRMKGMRTKWILGTDHAGIATQKQVEKALEAEGTSREAIGREAFVERVWAWREQYGGTIIEQFKRLGATLDYDDERFTLDEGYARAVLEVFVALYRKGLIYRDHYLVNWDPGTESAISDLEVEDRPVVDTLFHIAYPLEDGSGEVIVATVRPETMLADTAVGVHPDDERYRHLIGKAAILPLVGRRLPIIADEYVKPEFGTGALKITPGHDPNDFELGRRHGLDEISVIGEDGGMTAQGGPEFAGLAVRDAQEKVVAMLRAQGLVRHTEPYEHTVPFSHRSGERIEPLISLQWFMAMEELAAPAIAAVRDGRITIHPESQSRRYIDWLENIRPWCISRQLWWGHQIPVWYRGDEIHVDTRPPEGEGWERDPDVLDTWFSSALWPFATLGWPERTPELAAFYPTDVLSTARDILYLWVARMVMMGLEFTGDIPFADVYVHSVIQAPDGRRMSKSLGTGIDPLDEIERHGADAVRFGLLAMSSTQDVKYSSEKVQQGQRLANKLFNASRYVLLNVRDVEPEPRPQTVYDRWILSRLQAAKAAFADSVARFDFSKGALGLYDFVYGELCDWYLEFTKGREFDADLSATMLHVLRETLKLAHPMIPFVTEELWGHVPGTERLLATARITDADPALRDPAAEAEMAAVIEAVQALRSWRDEAGVKPGQVLPARIDGLDGSAGLVARMARLDLGGDGELTATVAVPGGSVEIRAGDLVDREAEARKAQVERERVQQEIARAEAKLGNEGFVAKAPPHLVQAERDKLERLRRELDG
jgi:valyl-tRNA synthetase